PPRARSGGVVVGLGAVGVEPGPARGTGARQGRLPDAVGARRLGSVHRAAVGLGPVAGGEAVGGSGTEGGASWLRPLARTRRSLIPIFRPSASPKRATTPRCRGCRPSTRSN